MGGVGMFELFLCPVRQKKTPKKSTKSDGVGSQKVFFCGPFVSHAKNLLLSIILVVY